MFGMLHGMCWSPKNKLAIYNLSLTCTCTSLWEKGNDINMAVISWVVGQLFFWRWCLSPGSMWTRPHQWLHPSMGGRSRWCTILRHHLWQQTEVWSQRGGDPEEMTPARLLFEEVEFLLGQQQRTCHILLLSSHLIPFPDHSEQETATEHWRRFLKNQWKTLEISSLCVWSADHKNINSDHIWPHLYLVCAHLSGVHQVDRDARLRDGQPLSLRLSSSWILTPPFPVLCW